MNKNNNNAIFSFQLTLFIQKMPSLLIVLLTVVYNWKTPYNSRTSNKMCTLCELKTWNFLNFWVWSSSFFYTFKLSEDKLDRVIYKTICLVIYSHLV